MERSAWHVYERYGPDPDIGRIFDSWAVDLFAILDLRQEVNSGGFDRYFSYWGGDSAPTAVAALARILGSDWSRLLVEAMDLLGSPYPSDRDRRSDLIEELGLSPQLSHLDTRFFELEDHSDADGQLDAFVRVHWTPPRRRRRFLLTRRHR